MLTSAPKDSGGVIFHIQYWCEMHLKHNPFVCNNLGKLALYCSTLHIESRQYSFSFCGPFKT